MVPNPLITRRRDYFVNPEDATNMSDVPRYVKDAGGNFVVAPTTEQLTKGFSTYDDNDFTKSELENSILFPHDLLNHANKTNYDNVNNIFLIFENIYCKNHLDNINYRMPQVFFNFKDIILKQLK